jgi:hypothetical protein
VAELEGRLAAEQECTRRLQQEKEEAAKSSEAALKTLRHEVEILSSAKEDLHAQLVDKEAKLAEVQKEAGELSGTLERYRADHIRSAETLRTDILGLLGQCNLDAPPIPFLQGTVEAFYEWVDACFDLVAMNTKIFGELGAAVGVHTLAYSVCSLVPADRPSSEKTISKGNLRRLTKDNFEWPADANLDVAQLPVLPKNLAKNFMNTFFAQRGYRLTLDESARLGAQVCRSHSYSCFETLLVMPLRTRVDILPSTQIRPRLQDRIYDRLRIRFGGTPPLPRFMTEGNWIAMSGVPLITAGGPEAAAREEGEVIGAPGDEAGVAEDMTAPTTKEERADGAPGPAAKVERTEAAEEAVPPAPASAETAPVPEVEFAPAPSEAVAAAATPEEDAGADASETAHVAELEAALLAAISPEREGPAEPAADAAAGPVETPVVAEGAEV